MVRKKYNVLFLFLLLLQFTAAGQETNLFKKYDLDKNTLHSVLSIHVFAEVTN